MQSASNTRLQRQREAAGGCFHHTPIKTSLNRVDMWCILIFFMHAWNTKEFVSSPLCLECLLFQKIMVSACEANMAQGALVTVGGELVSCSPCLRCCRGAAVVWILSVVCLPETICVLRCTVSIWGSAWQCDISDYQRVNLCETACICTSDPFLAPAASLSFSTFPSPQTPMSLQKHSQLFWGFLMGKRCKAKCFPFSTFVKFVSADQVI